MCFAGLRRLSGITRSVGGVPAANRARRRASFAEVNFVLRFLLAITASPFVILSGAARNVLSRKSRIYDFRSGREVEESLFRLAKGLAPAEGLNSNSVCVAAALFRAAPSLALG